MSNRKADERYTPADKSHAPEHEEFIDDGISDLNESDARKERGEEPVDVRERSMESLRRKARESGVTGYETMAREQLIESLRKV